MFTLHPQLERDTFFVTDLSLSRVLLVNNQNFPWLMLVPCVADIKEIIELTHLQQHQLIDEIAKASEVMKILYNPDKLNVAAIGNQVPQLHVHVIARFTKDLAWPHPVWGGKLQPYENPEPVTKRLAAAF
jgi:diadenosine tetraphosphate (Ap4A) HIT family hydrolase